MQSDKPAKIVHMTSVHPPFDVRIFHKECRSLAAAGYDVTLIAPHDRDEEKDGVKIRHIRKSSGNRLSRMLLTGMKVFARAWSMKADLYHFHDPELMPWAALLRLRGKVVYDVHEDVPQDIMLKNWIPVPLRIIVSKSSALAEWVGAHLFYSGIVAAVPEIGRRFPGNKSIVVQNFPVLKDIKPANTPLPFDEREHKIIYTGCIARNRGILEILQALDHGISDDTQFTIAGKFFPPALFDEARSLNGWKRTSFLGWVAPEQIIEQLHSAQAGIVTLHPTKTFLASYPVKMFEYMALGIPVIASDFPLWKEIIEKYNCGLCVDPLNPEEIAHAVNWVFNHPQQAENMGKNGQKIVAEKFNWTPQLEKLLKLYRQLLH